MRPGEYARDDDGDGFCEVHVNTLEGFWSLLRSWLRPHRGIPQESLPLYLGFFEFVHNVRARGKALLGALIVASWSASPSSPGCCNSIAAPARSSPSPTAEATRPCSGRRTWSGSAS